MRETVGWVCLSIGSLLSVVFFVLKSKAEGPWNPADNRSIFEREYERNSRSGPAADLACFLGLLFLFGGMYLIGMFGR